MKNILLFFFFCCTFFTQAQIKSANLFALNIGNFANPELSDFAVLQKYGLVYAVPMSNDQSQIFVGDFATKIEADVVLKKIGNSFPEAYIATKKTTKNNFPTIQLASKKVGEKINWKTFENAGNIFAASDGKVIRILSAGFTSDSIAKIGLATLKKLGYKDAVLKSFPEVNLHKISIFESGLSLDKPIKTEEKRVKKDSIAIKTPPPSVNPYAGNFPISELKKTLSNMGIYKGKIDDKEDKTLEKSFEEAKNKDKVLSKYVILAKAYIAEPSKVSDLQKAINNIGKDTDGSVKILEKSAEPIAKAYRAYALFTQNCDGKVINKLMNEALQSAFKGMKENKFAFDASANYDYTSLAQVIKHIRYIQGVTKEEISTPMWLFDEHPKETKAVFTDEYNIEATDPILNIEAVKMVKLMADDLVANNKKDGVKEQKNAQMRTKMAVNPIAIEESQEEWVKMLFDGLDVWATKDAVNQQTVTSFKAAFYQSVVQLQNQLAKQFNLPNSDLKVKNTALFTMKTLVEKPLAQYGREKLIK